MITLNERNLCGGNAERTLVFAKHKTWKEGISGIVYRASAEQITVMYPEFSDKYPKIIFLYQFQKFIKMSGK